MTRTDMANLLFLSHRLPYPPNKGDKVRSYHVLRHLAARHRVMLGTFVDHPDDEQHVPTVRAMCADLHVARLHPTLARLRATRGLLTREPLSLAYYRDRHLGDWVRQLSRGAAIDGLLVFSAPMLQYCADYTGPLVVDFADVESEKWSEYGRTRGWPMSWIYRREGRTLRGVERQAAARARWSVFATDIEAALFRRIAPEATTRIEVLGNGVDAEYFAPCADRPSPYDEGELPLVFIGTMDYWPNVDAVMWLVQEMLPRLRQRWPALRLTIVGRNPAPAVQRLAGDAVRITGTVPDVRPYVQHARAVAAPVRLARGIQNKVLEAMAMGRPVVATSRCVQAIDAQVNEHLLAADNADAFVRELGDLLDFPARAEHIGQAARERVVARYGWTARLRGLDRYFPIDMTAGVPA
ncbi:TIGR03087 family PEP-CTERM/XrtA system glycosyltransferase [Rubrivivax sp. RP6-9]|uniref:TIGR03087 family PEP-CTERM/XrtA system glycosyltransferase n=1 Tax=Rubrivivax sp. RP6-9 TaxID=3415750 RepID=UPI003CC5BB56